MLLAGYPAISVISIRYNPTEYLCTKFIFTYLYIERKSIYEDKISFLDVGSVLILIGHDHHLPVTVKGLNS